MGPPDRSDESQHSEAELDRLLALGSERPPQVQACVAEGSIDDGDLLAYRSGTLSEPARERVEEHLVACPFCRDLVAHIEAPRKGRRWPAVVIGAAAALAAIFLFVATPPPREPIGRYALVTSEGGNSDFRGEPEAKGRRFNPNSQVKLKIEPAGGRAASTVRVFRLEQGVLVDVPAKIERGEAGVFLIRGSGRELFGDSAGPKRLVIVAADEGADLSNIVGHTMMSAQALTTQASWLPGFDVEYQTE